MSVSRTTVGLVVGAALASAIGIGAWKQFADRSKLHVAELTREATSIKAELVGFTKYSDYLAAGQQSLIEQTKLLTATVKRTYRLTRKVEAGVLNTTLSTGAVVIEYDVEYSFGYDLKPEKYSVRNTPAGIEIRVSRPTMVAPAAVTNLRQEVLAGGWITNEEKATRKAYEGLAKDAQDMGHEMVMRPEIVALCEKTLTRFLRDFLTKQPGVKMVPSIYVVYQG